MLIKLFLKFTFCLHDQKLLILYEKIIEIYTINNNIQLYKINTRKSKKNIRTTKY